MVKDTLGETRKILDPKEKKKKKKVVEQGRKKKRKKMRGTETQVKKRDTNVVCVLALVVEIPNVCFVAPGLVPSAGVFFPLLLYTRGPHRLLQRESEATAAPLALSSTGDLCYRH